MAPSVVITCYICGEVYDLENKKPLLLPCSHTFCGHCLQEMKARDASLCPICGESWGSVSVDSLPAVLQLAGSRDKIKTTTRVRPAPDQNICYHKDPSIAWCEDCNSTSCWKCLETNHKYCNWVSIESKTTELISNLRKSVTSTRTELTRKFTDITNKNNSRVTNIRENISYLQRYEKIVLSFDEKMSTKMQSALKRLEKYEYIPPNSTVTELTTKISETLSLLDDPITEPTIPEFVVPDCEEPADDTEPEDEREEEASAGLFTDISTFPVMVRSVLETSRDLLLWF